MPKPQYTPDRLAFAQECARSGMADAEIVEKLRAAGAEGMVEGTLRAWWRKYGGRPSPGAPNAAPTPSPTPSPAADAVSPPAPRAMDLPGSVLTPDRTLVSKESLADDLSYLFNQQKALVQALTEKGDLVGAQRALRISTSLATLLQKQQAREADDGDRLRIPAKDIAAAAERARSKIHDLVSRLAEARR